MHACHCSQAFSILLHFYFYAFCKRKYFILLLYAARAARENLDLNLGKTHSRSLNNFQSIYLSSEALVLSANVCSSSSSSSNLLISRRAIYCALNFQSTTPASRCVWDISTAAIIWMNLKKFSIIIFLMCRVICCVITTEFLFVFRRRRERHALKQPLIDPNLWIIDGKRILRARGGRDGAADTHSYFCSRA
jgi:hypothetical protein